MSKWKYNLSTGKALRDAVDNDDNLGTLKALINCYEEIHNILPNVYDEDDLEYDIADIKDQMDNLENYEDYDMTEEDVQEEINILLDDFYNFCDGVRIWVDLD